MSSTQPAATASGQRTGATVPGQKVPDEDRQGGAAEQSYNAAAVGLILCAGILMVMGGIFQMLQGIVALFNDTFFVVGAEYVFEFDVTTWGWIHLGMGAIVAAAGAGLFSGAMWARSIAVVVAGLSMVTSFLWIPYYPVWSLLTIAFDAFVIWAVTVHGRDVRAE